MTTRERFAQDQIKNFVETDSLTLYLEAWTTRESRKEVEDIFFEAWKDVPADNIVNGEIITIGEVMFKAVAEYNRRRTYRRLGWGKTPFEQGDRLNWFT